jgi:predicted component of type VI protein secretion system
MPKTIEPEGIDQQIAKLQRLLFIRHLNRLTAEIEREKKLNHQIAETKG